MTNEQVTVLMVDDDEEDIYATKRAFRHGKFANEFRYVKTGAALFDYLENKGEFGDEAANPRPHIILLDINMPAMNGFEVLEKLRADDRYRKIPVVMLTTSSEDDDVVASYDKGVNSYISKPVDVDGMMNIARKFEDYWFELVRLPKT